MTAAAAGRRTALYDEHARLGATFTDFGGWTMPLRYASELAEHRAVRTTAGLFDLSHMGEVAVAGPGAGAFLDYALVGKLSAVAVGRAKYSLICTPEGGVIDDLITYRLTEDEYLVVPNAGNAAVVAAALTERARGFDVQVRDDTARTSLVAIQGPISQQVLLEVMPSEQADLVGSLRYYAATRAVVAGCDALVARTGYTGEDGFEVFVRNADAVALWQALRSAGTAHGLAPAGLAARDSLRLEAGMPLYGNELRLDLDPFAAGLGGLIALSKDGDFVGRDALAAARAEHEAQAPGRRVLVGLRGLARRAARPHQHVLVGGAVVGEVTSGAPSPTLGYPVALAYIDPAYAEPGTTVEVDVRGQLLPFEVVHPPFYRRSHTVTAQDRIHLRRCVELARQALDDGDEPFGSVLVDAAGVIRFEDRNRVKEGDRTRHPEFEIARWAAAHLSPDERRSSVVYTSGEHCAMCSAAHAWNGLGRIVYASSTEQLVSWHREWGISRGPVAALPINAVAPDVIVCGPDPALTDEIRELHMRLHGITS